MLDLMRKVIKNRIWIIFLLQILSQKKNLLLEDSINGQKNSGKENRKLQILKMKRLVNCLMSITSTYTDLLGNTLHLAYVSKQPG